jgi:hypothetical protein
MMTNKQLLKILLKLDKARTQGSIDLYQSGVDFVVTFGGEEVAIVKDRDCETPQESMDAQFLAHAGDMMQVIQQLQKDIKDIAKMTKNYTRCVTQPFYESCIHSMLRTEQCSECLDEHLQKISTALMALTHD